MTVCPIGLNWITTAIGSQTLGLFCLEDCVAINSDCPHGLRIQLGPVLNFAYWIFLPVGWKHLFGGHFGLATVWRVSIGRS